MDKYSFRHVVEAQQFDRARLERLFFSAKELTNLKKRWENPPLIGLKFMSLFYEASTRTRLSFEAAALNLGMSVLGTEDARQFSSAKKGETLEDTIRVLSGYGIDCIALRHDEDDAAERAAEVCPKEVVLINAGAGKNQHPTQALTDLFTIWDETGRLDNLTITAGGDLLNSRVIRSLAYLTAKFEGIKFIFISPKQLAIKDDIKQYLDRKGVVWQETAELEDGLREANIIYWTRAQFERGTGEVLGSEQEIREMELRYRIGPRQLELLKPDSVIMHPLPRNWEIDPAVDKDPRAAYFRQAHNGMRIRMSLLLELLHPTFESE